MLDIIQPLKRFVHTEYDAQIAQVHELWDKSVEFRVAEGVALANLEILRSEMRSISLRCRDNQSKFRVGDKLVLSRGNPREHPLACELEQDLGDSVVLIPDYGVVFPGNLSGQGWVLDQNVSDIRHVLLEMLDTVAASDRDVTRFTRLFSGQILPAIDRTREAKAAVTARALGLNASQTEAFARSYATENLYLVQGPPGTGKTWMLAHLATELAKAGQRVLITAFTHRAINNALLKIAKTTGHRHTFKIGQRTHAADLAGVVNNYEYFANSGHGPGDKGIIVGGTGYIPSTKRLRDVHFDTVIFDEAGQVTLPLAISCMLVADKAIFIGDHKQMAPVIAGKHAEEWVSRSVFETLFTAAPGTMLDVTHRMNGAINAFPSRHFYGNRLRPSPAAENQRLKLACRPTTLFDVLDPAKPAVFAELTTSRRGMRSPEEAELIARIVEEAIRCGVPAAEIAVVAPYRAQVRLIRNELIKRRVLQSAQDTSELVVDTVERIQGQEREMIIISLTTSDPGHATTRAEFFFQPNRLNVAITRARAKRIVIGSPSLFAASPKDPKVRAWVDMFHTFYKESVNVRCS